MKGAKHHLFFFFLGGVAVVVVVVVLMLVCEASQAFWNVLHLPHTAVGKRLDKSPVERKVAQSLSCGLADWGKQFPSLNRSALCFWEILLSFPVICCVRAFCEDILWCPEKVQQMHIMFLSLKLFPCHWGNLRDFAFLLMKTTGV